MTQFGPLLALIAVAAVLLAVPAAGAAGPDRDGGHKRTTAAHHASKDSDKAAGKKRRHASKDTDKADRKEPHHARKDSAKADGKTLGCKPKLTPHQKQEAIRRRDEGESVRAIARSYNVSASTISRLPA